MLKCSIYKADLSRLWQQPDPLYPLYPLVENAEVLEESIQYRISAFAFSFSFSSEIMKPSLSMLIRRST